MDRKFPIDSHWFFEELQKRGQSLRGLAKFLQLDPGAVSRMLNGQRAMSAGEQDRIAAFFGVGLHEIAQHRGQVAAGFEEEKQDAYVAGTATLPASDDEMFTEADIVYKDGQRWMDEPEGLIPLHPLYGCMKGTLIIPDDLDLTAPIEFEWGGKLYNE